MKNAMKRCVELVAMLVLGSSALPAAEDRGPLDSVNEHPIETVFIAWPLQDPHLMRDAGWRWRVEMNLTNLFKDDSPDPSRRLLVDAETLRINFTASRCFREKWQVDAQISVFRMSGGFLDGFIRAFENHLWFRRRGPESGIDDQFRYLLRWDGRDIIDRSGGSFGGLGDMQVRVKRRLVDRPEWAVAAIGAIKLPTGRSGLGSGGVDGGFGVAASRTIGRCVLRGELDATLLSDFQGIPARSRLMFKSGVEYVRTRYSLYMQTDLRGSAIHWGKSTMDELPFQITFGGKFRKPAKLLHEIYIVEDLSRATPDVTLAYGVEW